MNYYRYFVYINKNTKFNKITSVNLLKYSGDEFKEIEYSSKSDFYFITILTNLFFFYLKSALFIDEMFYLPQIMMQLSSNLKYLANMFVD